MRTTTTTTATCPYTPVPGSTVEILRHGRAYYAYIRVVERGGGCLPLPEHLGYGALKRVVLELTGLELPSIRELEFEREGWKAYASFELPGQKLTW